MAVPNVERVEWDGLTSIPFVSTRPVAQLRTTRQTINTTYPRIRLASRPLNIVDIFQGPPDFPYYLQPRSTHRTP